MTEKEILLVQTALYLMGKNAHPLEIKNTYELMKRALEDSKKASAGKSKK
jgi:hypothetical protein